MALKIRLRKQGRNNRQTFRLVVTDIRNPRDGKYLETLGSYNPYQAENNFKLNAERLDHWLSLGAEISENAQKLIAKASPGVIKSLNAKKQEKRQKMAAKRRALKKGKKIAQPTTVQSKTNHVAAEETPAPKKKSATTKRKSKNAD